MMVLIVVPVSMLMIVIAVSAMLVFVSVIVIARGTVLMLVFVLVIATGTMLMLFGFMFVVAAGTVLVFVCHFLQLLTTYKRAHIDNPGEQQDPHEYHERIVLTSAVLRVLQHFAGSIGDQTAAIDDVVDHE